MPHPPLYPCLALAALLPTLPAMGTVWQYDVISPTPGTLYNDVAGVITSIHSAYDATGQTLTWTADFAVNPSNGIIPDGFSLVLSDGPNPKDINHQLGIFYLDASGSFDGSGAYNGTTPILNAFSYNGSGSDGSYSNPSVGLLSSIGLNSADVIDLSASGDSLNRQLSFTIDTSNLDDGAFVGSRFAAAGVGGYNPADWEGVGYDENIGVWFHPLAETEFTYGTDASGTAGFVTDIQDGAHGWYDIEDANTVPEPSAASTAFAAAPAA